MAVNNLGPLWNFMFNRNLGTFLNQLVDKHAITMAGSSVRSPIRPRKRNGFLGWDLVLVPGGGSFNLLLLLHGWMSVNFFDD